MLGNIKFSTSTPLVNIDRRPKPWGLGLDRFGLVTTLDVTIVFTLALLIVLGLSLRVTQLGAIGFAEDEVNKLDAIHAYERGDYSANAEHPMLMKVLMLISRHAAPNASEEASLRFPNALIGALTVIPIFLLTAAFFDRWTALLAASFWAFGINAITHNRIGKEDSLLVFFMLFAFYFFLRAKQTTPLNKEFRRKNYIASAVSFGLMIASKYFPHYLGLNMLFHHNFHAYTPRADEASGKTPGLFFLLIIAVFLLASPAILMPQVWQYMNAYMGERLLSHSGYLFAGQLYKNNMSSSPFWGTPIYFYLLFLAIKVPLLTLGAFLFGLAVSIKRRRELGYAFLIFMFLFWIVPYSLIGGKWLRYTLSVMPFVYMIAAVGVMALVRWGKSRLPTAKQVSVLSAGVAILLFVLLPAWIAYSHGPHYALYTNALAANQAGFYFPHDEFYDDGLREAIKHVCEQAPKGAIIAHETPAVVRHYLTTFERTDLISHPISASDFNPANASGPIYVIAQRGRTYFENRDELSFVRSNFRKIDEVKVDGLSAVEVFANR
ncbi:MAG TPA: glycosyltransferase family 39 protein [Pyrinomonadaceae bacterium]|nr:glycosyltransferase family 39 protein [Pyrinomonadaceae bacterium]